jgi:hypothetical protein
LFFQTIFSLREGRRPTCHVHIGAPIDMDSVNFDKIPKYFRGDVNKDSESRDKCDVLACFIEHEYPGLEVIRESNFENNPKHYLCFEGEPDATKLYDGGYTMKTFDREMIYAKSEEGQKLFKSAMKKLNQGKEMFIFGIPYTKY